MRPALLSLASALLLNLSTRAQTDQTWIDLDGVDDYLDLGTDPILAGKTQFTVDMRVHFDNSSGEYTIIGQRNSDLNRTFVIQRWSGALYILFDGSNYASCAFEPCTAEIYHLAVTYTGAGASNNDRLKFYVNGEAQTLAYTGTIPATTLVTSPAADLVLGCEHNGPDAQLQFLDGQFGEVCFWDHALSPADIGARVGSEVSGSETGLLEYFHFANGMPGGNNVGIISFSGGLGVSTIVPTNLALFGASSNFIGPPTLAGAINVSTSVAGQVITATMAGATYQWLDCDDAMATIPGATAQSYTATANGHYAVRITVGACSDTSACVAITSTGVAERGLDQWVLAPNPVQELLIIEGAADHANIPFQVMDPSGRVVHRGVLSGRTVVPVQDLERGLYLLQLGEGNGRVVKLFERE